LGGAGQNVSGARGGVGSIQGGKVRLMSDINTTGFANNGGAPGKGGKKG